MVEDPARTGSRQDLKLFVSLAVGGLEHHLKESDYLRKEFKYMKKMMFRVSLALALAAGFAFAQTKTGQGIMVDLQAAGDYAIVTTETYEFNKSTAAGYFTNELDSSVAPTCSPAAKCGSTAPTAPAPDPSKVNSGSPGANDVAGKNRCAFLVGGSLIGGTYEQKVDVGSPPNKATWTFTYKISPTGPVDPKTAWDLISSEGDGTTAAITVNASIAGESVVSNGKNAKVGTKYSFDLGTTEYPRVTDIALALNGEWVASPAVSIGFPVDFNYTTNAGSNGDTSLLKDGDARTILNSDSFAGNDNGGSDGAALARAVIEAVQLNLPVGTHTVTLTGVVKGNNALRDLPINVTATITVIAEGCEG